MAFELAHNPPSRWRSPSPPALQSIVELRWRTRIHGSIKSQRDLQLISSNFVLGTLRPSICLIIRHGTTKPQLFFCSAERKCKNLPTLMSRECWCSRKYTLTYFWPSRTFLLTFNRFSFFQYKWANLTTTYNSHFFSWTNASGKADLQQLPIFKRINTNKCDATGVFAADSWVLL